MRAEKQQFSTPAATNSPEDFVQNTEVPLPVGERKQTEKAFLTRAIRKAGQNAEYLVLDNKDYGAKIQGDEGNPALGATFPLGASSKSRRGQRTDNNRK